MDSPGISKDQKSISPVIIYWSHSGCCGRFADFKYWIIKLAASSVFNAKKALLGGLNNP